MQLYTYTFSKEFGEGYRTLIFHLRPLYHLLRNHVFDLHLQNMLKATVESDISRKDASQWLVPLFEVSFFQNGFSHKFCWFKSINETFGANRLIISEF